MLSDWLPVVLQANQELCLKVAWVLYMGLSPQYEPPGEALWVFLVVLGWYGQLWYEVAARLQSDQFSMICG